MKILCAGDLHIGRRPSRLPDRIDTAPLSCAHAWGALVDRAIADGVDLVALSGDVVDESNRYYEAIGPLESGVRRLASHGIRTVAVAGNHDHDVLPWLARAFPREEFALIGQTGWERVTIERDGRPALHVDGWSFTERACPDDPLAGYALPPSPGVPVLGLLHCDLDQVRSVYAPVRLVDLRARAVDFWLLGHIHAANLMTGESGAPVLYPGSPQAMDPGETGVHGAWMVEVDGGGRFSARPIPLATVRYETVPVDLGDASDEGDVGRRVTEAVRRYLRECVDAGCGPLRYLSLRLLLTGRTALHREVARIADSIAADLEIEHSGVRAVVERAIVATRPARDLEALARGADAPGELARLLLALESGALSTEQARLVSEAARSASDARAAPVYASLADDVEVTRNEARRLLAEEAATLLDELLAQKEAA